MGARPALGSGARRPASAGRRGALAAVAGGALLHPWLSGVQRARAIGAMPAMSFQKDIRKPLRRQAVPDDKFKELPGPPPEPHRSQPPAVRPHCPALASPRLRARRRP